MAGRGPASTDPKSRRRRNKKASATQHAHRGDRAELAPPLPPSYYLDDTDGGKVRYLQATKDWWEAWAHAPWAGSLTETDWRYLADVVAPLYDQTVRRPARHAAELRLQLAGWGNTIRDRNGLDWVVKPPKPDDKPTAAASDDPDESGPREDPRLRAIQGGKA